jgi:transcription antitermination factor NusG
MLEVGQGGEACEMTPNWYALYVRSQYEHKVSDALSRLALEQFLPLYWERARWSDRTKTVERILFPGYVFGRFHPEARRDVLGITGMVRILGIGAHPMPVADREIEQVRAVVDSGLNVVTIPLLTAGQRVRVEDGALAGMEGIVIRLKGELRVVVSVPLLGRSVATELDTDRVIPIAALKQAA